MSNQVEDAIICPVSTQYDKVIEVDSYISELLGQPKPKESLSNFLSSSSILSLKLGRVDVRFHEPWSLRQFVNEQTTRLQPSSTSLQKTYDNNLKRKILSTLGYRVLADINAVSVVMPTALIGTVLLTLRGRGVGFSELVRRVDWLTARVQAKGGRVAHFASSPTSTVVEKGLEVLGPKLVGQVEGLPERTYFAADRFQLSFYRNMTIHLFVEEALVSAAIYIKVKAGGGPENQKISYAELEEYVYFLSQVSRVSPFRRLSLVFPPPQANTTAAIPCRVHFSYHSSFVQRPENSARARGRQRHIHHSLAGRDCDPIHYPLDRRTPVGPREF